MSTDARGWESHTHSMRYFCSQKLIIKIPPIDFIIRLFLSLMIWLNVKWLLLKCGKKP